MLSPLRTLFLILASSSLIYTTASVALMTHTPPKVAPSGGQISANSTGIVVAQEVAQTPVEPGVALIRESAFVNLNHPRYRQHKDSNDCLLTVIRMVSSAYYGTGAELPENQSRALVAGSLVDKPLGGNPAAVELIDDIYGSRTEYALSVSDVLAHLSKNHYVILIVHASKGAWRTEKDLHSILAYGYDQDYFYATDPLDGQDKKYPRKMFINDAGQTEFNYYVPLLDGKNSAFRAIRAIEYITNEPVNKKPSI